MSGGPSWLLPRIAKNTPIELFGFRLTRRIFILGSEGLSVCQVSCLLWEVTHERCAQTTSRSSHCQTSRVLRSGDGETPGLALAALRSCYRFGSGAFGKCSCSGFQPCPTKPHCGVRSPLPAGRTPFEFAQRPSDPGRSAGDVGAQFHGGFRGRGGIRCKAAQGPPAISTGGVVPVYGTANMIQPGEWVSIYGTNLASGTAVWNNDFPTSLGNTSVTINGRPAYLSMVSPGQINLQAPDDTALGAVSCDCYNEHGGGRSNGHVKREFAGLSPARCQACDGNHPQVERFRDFSAMARTTSWAPQATALAILRLPPRLATLSSCSALASGRRIPPCHRERHLPAPRP